MASILAKQRSTSDSTLVNKRPRVGKACNRCRLKKSKCDGTVPCLRCQTDNAICEFGPHRKPAHDRPHPKGYVEMLEHQRSQLVSGLREMYKRLQEADAWAGPILPNTNGFPLTHDILASLNVLQQQQEAQHDNSIADDEMLDLDSALMFTGESATSSQLPTPADTDILHPDFGFFQPDYSLDDGVSPYDTQSTYFNETIMTNDPLFYQADWALALDAATQNKNLQWP